MTCASFTEYDHPALGGHPGDVDRVLEAVEVGRRTAGAVPGVGQFRGGSRKIQNKPLRMIFEYSLFWWRDL